MKLEKQKEVTKMMNERELKGEEEEVKRKSGRRAGRGEGFFLAGHDSFRVLYADVQREKRKKHTSQIKTCLL